jgi:hypothetical protein
MVIPAFSAGYLKSQRSISNILPYEQLGRILAFAFLLVSA